jgi:hypothetical protein
MALDGADGSAAEALAQARPNNVANSRRFMCPPCANDAFGQSSRRMVARANDPLAIRKVEYFLEFLMLIIFRQGRKIAETTHYSWPTVHGFAAKRH